MQPERLLTIADIAERLGVERHTAGVFVRQMPRVMPGGKNGKLIRVRQSDFENWLAENTMYPAPTPSKKDAGRRRSLTMPDPALFEPNGALKRRGS